MIEVYKASAGSGKTETLTRNYLKLLLDGATKDKEKYRHILAVTFTNKATDEMKERVLNRLFELSKQDTAEGKLAKEVLIRILHDYSAFSITTIDRFFQQVTRSFAKEIGQYSSYRVELEDKNVLQLAVDNLFDSLDQPEKKDVLKWVVDYALDQIEDTGNNNIAKTLLSMAELFLKEDFRIKKINAEKEGRFITDTNSIYQINDRLMDYIISFEDLFMKNYQEIAAILEAVGLAPEDFYHAKSSGVVSLRKIATCKERPLPTPNKYFDNLLDGVHSWITKRNATPAIMQKVQKADQMGLLDKFLAVNDLYFEHYQVYIAAILVKSNVKVFGLFNEIYNNLDFILKENNLMLLSETTEAIHKIIDGSDVPFLYEKVGNRYDNYMLDEFQDTSVLQWENFLPLLNNSLAADHYNMIVGDVKQSIYRWRSSDWNTLNSGIIDAFRLDQLSFPQLIYNYRSGKEIVKFNSDFFKKIGELMGEQAIADIYESANQYPQKEFDGFLEFNFIEKKREQKWKSVALENMVLSVKKLTQELGYPYSSLAILTRTRNESRIVAEKLIQNGFPVISEDSLIISASPQVRKIVAILSAIIMPDDEQVKLILKQFNIESHTISEKFSNDSEKSLYNLCEEIIRDFCPNIPKGEIIYVNTFLDHVLEFQKNYGSHLQGLINWWQDKGISISISMPDSADAIQVFTIHKAKGLEMDIVILPFLDLAIKHNSQNPTYLWVTPPISFSEIGLIPMKYNKMMYNSIFADEYIEEALLTKIDAVNTAYVAFTRAKVGLITFSPYDSEDKSREADYISYYLYKYLQENSGSIGAQYSCGTEITYSQYIEANQGGKPKKEESNIEQIAIEEFVSVPPQGGEDKNRLKMAFKASEFFEGYSRRIKGIVLHDIMSAVIYPQDLKDAVNEAVREGKLSEDYMAEVLQLLQSRIDSHPEWFNHHYQVLNEVSILNTDGLQERPDRVLIEGKNAIVIDYKFGEEKTQYKYQLLRYMKAFREMGYKEIKGYIWYVEEDKVVPIA